MNYRKVYLKIISNAKLEMEQGVRTKKNGEYYENHHIFPKSLFPLWGSRKSNLVLLTAREHFFCHQLLTKIWPGREMSYALNAFLWGYKTSNKKGVQRTNKYKITSREYEKIRSQMAKYLSVSQKEVWSNKTDEELQDWGKRHSKAMHARTKEQKEATLKKYRETLKNRPKEEWKRIKEKSKTTRLNKTDEELKVLHNKLSKNTKDKKWFNDGKSEILAYECPEGFIKGRIPDKEARIKAGITNKERNKTRGSAQSRMTQEQYDLWKKHLSESHGDARKIYANMSEEVKQARAQKISNTLKGRKMPDETKKRVSEGIYNSPKHADAVKKCADAHRGKKFFNNGIKTILAETCPEGFVPGIIRKKKETQE